MEEKYKVLREEIEHLKKKQRELAAIDVHPTLFKETVRAGQVAADSALLQAPLMLDEIDRMSSIVTNVEIIENALGVGWVLELANSIAKGNKL